MTFLSIFQKKGQNKKYIYIKIYYKKIQLNLCKGTDVYPLSNLDKLFHFVQNYEVMFNVGEIELQNKN